MGRVFCEFDYALAAVQVTPSFAQSWCRNSLSLVGESLLRPGWQSKEVATAGVAYRLTQYNLKKARHTDFCFFV